MLTPNPSIWFECILSGRTCQEEFGIQEFARACEGDARRVFPGSFNRFRNGSILVRPTPVFGVFPGPIGYVDT